MGEPLAVMARATRLFHSNSALGRALHISHSHVSRVLSGEATINAALAIRLADLLGESRADVLRGCGHGELADLLYPQGAR
jgi:hypothetical protein